MLTFQKSLFGLSTLLALLCLSLLDTNVHGQGFGVKLFESTSHDFGDVLKGEVPEYRFKFVNNLNETLHIRSVKSSCGCTEATASQETYYPGQQGEIICRYNTPTTKFPGKKDASIIVLFDSPRLVEQQLTVKGNIITGISLKPSKIEFGQTTAGKTEPVKILLTSTENPDFRLKKVKSVDYIDVQFNEIKRTETGVVCYELATTLLDSTPRGYFQGDIFLELELGRQPDSAPKTKTLPLGFAGKLNSPLQLSLATLDFGPMKPGENITRKLFLTSTKPFKVSKVNKGEGKGFSVTHSSTKSNETCIIEVTCKAGEKPGIQESELEFFVEYPNTSPTQTNSTAVKVVAEISNTGKTTNQINR